MEPLVPRLILVPTDFSAPASHALRYASALGERFGAHLLVIYADSFTLPVDFTASGTGAFTASRETMIEEAREELGSHAERNISATVPYDLRVIVDNPLDAITAAVRESGANLVVMGTHGRSGIPRLLFGSVTESVMRIASVPVIAVNSSTSENASVSRVLCPVDFTAACRAALRQAVALADSERAPILLFRGVEGKELHPSIQELIRLHEWAPSEIAGRSELKTVLTSAPAEEILDLALATATDLIAIEIRSDRSLADDLRGTVAERIVQQSHCPVLTVNSFAARSFPNNIENVRQLVAVG
jgi:nucleotide-binding universal stress UspA family protein